MRKTPRGPALLAPLAFLVLIAASPSSFVGNASVWDSTIAADPAHGVYPIGGSGQINGDFWVKNGHVKTGPVQAGIRAQERFVGPLEPRGRKYFAPVGADADGLAMWNFDLHLDFGYVPDGIVDDDAEPIGPSDHTADDFAIFLFADCDPARNNRPVKVRLDDVWPAAKLAQESWNMGFGFLEEAVCQAQGLTDFPAGTPGKYLFGIQVRELKKRGPHADRPGNGNGNGGNGHGNGDTNGHGNGNGNGGHGNGHGNGRDVGKIVAQQRMIVIVR